MIQIGPENPGLLSSFSLLGQSNLNEAEKQSMGDPMLKDA